MGRDEIQSIAIERKIPFLVHFTRSENVSSIMRHGLLPVANARAQEIDPIVNDQERLDGRLNGTSVSIAFPNGNLFYRFRKKILKRSGSFWQLRQVYFGQKGHCFASIMRLICE